MEGAVLAAVIAAVASLLVAAFTAHRSRTASKELEELKAALNARADLEKHEREGEVLLSRYREPLTAAAFDLQSRLYNIVERDFLEAYVRPGSEREEEAITSTLFRFAQYFGWTEIVRQDINFLKFRETGETRAVANRLNEVLKIFNDDQPSLSPDFMLWRDELRAIGELMIAKDGGTKACLGYAGFVAIYGTHFERWLGRFGGHLKDEYVSADDRLVLLQRALVMLVRQLDPKGLQYKHSTMSIALEKDKASRRPLTR